MVVPFTTENDVHINMTGGVDPGQQQLPSAPLLVLSNNSTNSNLSNSNSDIYVNFAIIENGNMYTIRGEKQPLIDGSEELGKILTGQKIISRHNDAYVIAGVSRIIFEIFIRYLETKFIKFTNDSKQILQLFEVAMQFQCSEFMIKCIEALDLTMSEQTVIDIYRTVRCYCPNTDRLTNGNDEWSLSAQINTTVNNNSGKNNGNKTKKSTKNKKWNYSDLQPTNSESYLSCIIYNCLQFIDERADSILIGDAILKLRYEELDMIVRRNTLQINCETILINTLIRWSRAECDRKHLDITAENRRRVLGSLIYCPRYLLMHVDKFEKSLLHCELLDETEMNMIRNRFRGKTTQLTCDQQDMLIKFQRKRPVYPKMPIHLSKRSHHLNYSRKMRNYRYYEDDDDENSCGNQFCFHICIFFACVCD